MPSRDPVNCMTGPKCKLGWNECWLSLPPLHRLRSLPHMGCPVAVLESNMLRNTHPKDQQDFLNTVLWAVRRKAFHA